MVIRCNTVLFESAQEVNYQRIDSSDDTRVRADPTGFKPIAKPASDTTGVRPAILERPGNTVKSSG